jgi:hypothetical protein
MFSSSHSARFRALLVCLAVMLVPLHAAAQDLAHKFGYAASEGDIGSVKKILDGGYDVNTQWGTFRQFGLLKAAEWGHLEMVRFLLSRGADPRLQDSSGRTALAWATNNGHAAVVRELRQAQGLPPEQPRAQAAAAGPAPAPRPAPAAAPAAAAADAGATPQDGRWRGTVHGITNGGTQYVEFRVRAGQIVESTFHVDYHCAPQYVYRERSTLGFDRPIAVEQGRFTATRTAPAVELNAAGRFATPTTAEGTFKMEDSQRCTTRLARWNARRVGG